MVVDMKNLIFGLGVNDSDYAVTKCVNGIRVTCQFYARWHNMLRRCYSDNFMVIRPAYKDCYVCKEWLTFSNFKSWMIKQDWEGKELDKDLKLINNKCYSPETCVFVSQSLNKFFTDRRALMGKHPQGVHLFKGKYQSAISFNGKTKYLGMHNTVNEAEIEYLKCKIGFSKQIASNPENLSIKCGVISRIDLMNERLKLITK